MEPKACAVKIVWKVVISCILVFFIIAAMASESFNALYSLWYKFTFTFFSTMIFLYVNWCLIQIHLSHWFHKMVNFCTNQNNFKYCILSWCENVLSPSQTSKIEKIEHFLPILILNKIPRLPFNIDSPLIEVHFNWENLIWDFYSPLSEVLLCCWVKSSRSSSIT